MNYFLKYKYIFLFISISFFCFTQNIEAQTINTKFGKNRVQYSNDFNNWWLYDTDDYSIFWYTKELNLAKAVILLSQISYDDIEEILDFKINKKIKIIIYSDLFDYNQSNFGIKDESISNESGTSKIIDNKFIIYFDGNFTHLLDQIREGTATIFIKNMFSNLSFENVYNNIINSAVPEWFKQGSAAYLSNKWDIKSDFQLRRFFSNKKKSNYNFEDLARKMPKLAGKSFLYFIDNQYDVISDLFYLERITRNLNNSLKSTTGHSFENLIKEWSKYYQNIYNAESIDNNPTGTLENIITSNYNNISYPSVKISDENKYLAYSKNNYGKKHLFVVDLTTNKKTKLFTTGYINREQLSNPNYPLFNFYPSSDKIAFIYKHRDESVLRIVNIKTKEILYDKPLPLKLKSILCFDIWDKKSVMISANVNGNIDIFKYNTKKRTIKQITDDYWIDRDIKTSVMKGEKGLLFASNRINQNLQRDYIDTILPTTKLDIFFLNIDKNKLIRLTNTKDINEYNPIFIKNKLLYISDETGIPNIVSKSTDTNKIFLTNNNFNLKTFDLNSQGLLFSEKDICFNSIRNFSFEDNRNYNPESTFFRKSLIQSKTKKKNKTEDQRIEIEKGLLFQSKFKGKLKMTDDKKDVFFNPTSKNKRLKSYISSHAIASRLKFSFSKFTTRLDNEPLFDGQSIYTEEENSYTPPKAGILTKVLIKDMFDDYFIETGLRISPDFKEKEFFTVYDNLKHLIDWQYVYYRKAGSKFIYNRPNIVDKFKNTTNLFRVRAKYPFNVYKSLSLSANLRFDENSILASDTISLNTANNTEQRISLKLEYIFDNTGKLGINLLEGNRSKAFIEVYNKFNFNPNSSNKIQLSEGFMTVLGYDMRQYFKVLKYSIIAFRAAGQTSFGSESNIYFLGGMENWQFSKYANATQNIKNESIAYKILAANLRGFGYNAKSGSSFALFSSELRIPVFKYLFATNNKFIRDFQFTLFFDSGLTWNGISPFSKENTSNTKYIEIPPTIKIKLQYYSDPFIAGYGVGIRSTLFGYFLKLDYGWGIQNKSVLKPILYFTVGQDF